MTEHFTDIRSHQFSKATNLAVISVEKKVTLVPIFLSIRILRRVKGITYNPLAEFITLRVC